MSNLKKMWIGIGVLALLSPLGLILPAFFKAGGAWGEWGLDEIEKIAGSVPAGMRRLAEIWKAPLQHYGLPNQSTGLLNESLGYVMTAIIGVAFTAAIMFLLTKLLVKKDKKQ
jgi:hypothetical protein